MAAPRQRIELDQRRVGDLHEEDALARDPGDRRDVVANAQGVEAVEHEAHRRVICLLDDLERMAEGAHVAAPAERLVADPQAPARRALAERIQVGRGERIVVDRIERDAAAHQHEVGLELAHQVELALGAVEVALQLRARPRLEIAERLEQHDAQAAVVGDALDVGGRAVEVEQVVLEDLDAVEAGRRDRGQLVDQRAAERDRGDGTEHSEPPVRCRRGSRNRSPCRPG
jgi:hypothetical protein